MGDPKEIFETYCRKNGMRCTPERNLIIDEIYCKDGHFDIDDLFLRVRKKYSNVKIAKGSIYRTVPHLIKSGLIRESYAADGHICYEHTLGHTHHDHMKCLVCGGVMEFFNKDIDRIQEDICAQRKFKLAGHVHVLLGYCKKCRKSG